MPDTGSSAPHRNRGSPALAFSRLTAEIEIASLTEPGRAGCARPDGGCPHRRTTIFDARFMRVQLFAAKPLLKNSPRVLATAEPQSRPTIYHCLVLVSH